jgi:molybdopterin-guanine dinucleotide biosynthesis protein A
MSKITIAILAGGKSSRMGQDKSFVELNGRYLIHHVLDQIANLGDEHILITNKPDEYAFLGLPMYGDVYPDHGSLGGIYTAVYHASQPHTLVVACDMPWLKRPLLQYMLDQRHTADVVVPRWDKYPEPLHAVYSKACLPAIEAKLQAQQLKITSFFGQVRVHFVERDTIAQYDPDGQSFTNLNTPDELQQAQINKS